jgi:hypothetical protein
MKGMQYTSGMRYTPEETILCTYAALYDVHDFGGYAAIATLTGRSAYLFDAKSVFSKSLCRVLSG